MVDKTFDAWAIAIGTIMIIAALVAWKFSTPNIVSENRFLTIEQQRAWHVEKCIDRIKEQPQARALCERIVQLKNSQFK